MTTSDRRKLPIGIIVGVICIAGIGAVATVYLKELHTARGRAREVASGANLAALGRAMALYAEDPANAGAYPADLDTLVALNLIIEDSLRSPRDRAAGPLSFDTATGKIVGRPSYVYLPPPPYDSRAERYLTPAGPVEWSQLVIVYERTGLVPPDGMVPVLFADYGLTRMPVDELRRLLEAQGSPVE